MENVLNYYVSGKKCICERMWCPNNIQCKRILRWLVFSKTMGNFRENIFEEKLEMYDNIGLSSISWLSCTIWLLLYFCMKWPRLWQSFHVEKKKNSYSILHLTWEKFLETFERMKFCPCSFFSVAKLGWLVVPVALGVDPGKGSELWLNN